MTACAKLTASASAPRRPSRTSRRQVNNWPADNPYLRAVADTRRGALALSATIRRFSSGVQRRRAPVSITSSRDTFDIVVCSVIRLCLRGFIPQRKAAVAGGLRRKGWQVIAVARRSVRAARGALRDSSSSTAAGRSSWNSTVSYSRNMSHSRIQPLRLHKRGGGMSCGSPFDGRPQRSFGH